LLAVFLLSTFKANSAKFTIISLDFILDFCHQFIFIQLASLIEDFVDLFFGLLPPIPSNNLKLERSTVSVVGLHSCMFFCTYEKTNLNLKKDRIFNMSFQEVAH
jgi:hypothetical protein